MKKLRSGKLWAAFSFLILRWWERTPNTRDSAPWGLASHPFCLSYKILHDEATVAVLAVSAVMAVSVFGGEKKNQ